MSHCLGITPGGLAAPPSISADIKAHCCLLVIVVGAAFLAGAHCSATWVMHAALAPLEQFLSTVIGQVCRLRYPGQRRSPLYHLKQSGELCPARTTLAYENAEFSRLPLLACVTGREHVA